MRRCNTVLSGQPLRPHRVQGEARGGGLAGEALPDGPHALVAARHEVPELGVHGQRALEGAVPKGLQRVRRARAAVELAFGEQGQDAAGRQVRVHGLFHRHHALLEVGRVRRRATAAMHTRRVRENARGQRLKNQKLASGTSGTANHAACLRLQRKQQRERTNKFPLVLYLCCCGCLFVVVLCDDAYVVDFEAADFVLGKVHGEVAHGAAHRAQQRHLTVKRQTEQQENRVRRSVPQKHTTPAHKTATLSHESSSAS